VPRRVTHSHPPSAHHLLPTRIAWEVLDRGGKGRRAVGRFVPVYGRRHLQSLLLFTPSMSPSMTCCAQAGFVDCRRTKLGGCCGRRARLMRLPRV
jgi:hypothetical protein